jgi:hypothetical protein
LSTGSATSSAGTVPVNVAPPAASPEVAGLESIVSAMHLEQSDESIRLTSSGLLSRLIGVFTLVLGLAGVLVAVAAADGFVWARLRATTNYRGAVSSKPRYAACGITRFPSLAAFERRPAGLAACCKLTERAGVRNPSQKLPTFRLFYRLSI